LNINTHSAGSLDYVYYCKGMYDKYCIVFSVFITTMLQGQFDSQEF